MGFKTTLLIPPGGSHYLITKAPRDGFILEPVLIREWLPVARYRVPADVLTKNHRRVEGLIRLRPL